MFLSFFTVPCFGLIPLHWNDFNIKMKCTRNTMVQNINSLSTIYRRQMSKWEKKRKTSQVEFEKIELKSKRGKINQTIRGDQWSINLQFLKLDMDFKTYRMSLFFYASSLFSNVQGEMQTHEHEKFELLVEMVR